MPPPDRPEVLLHKARQDELVVERLLGDRAGHEETPDSRTESGAVEGGQVSSESAGCDLPQDERVRPANFARQNDLSAAVSSATAVIDAVLKIR